jgi:hypothetical protein
MTYAEDSATIDIVTRLRKGGDDICKDGAMWPGDDMLEAAKEIARLRTALATARRDVLEEAVLAIQNEIHNFADPSYAANQPLGSFSERFACECCEKAISALQENHNGQ